MICPNPDATICRESKEQARGGGGGLVGGCLKSLVESPLKSAKQLYARKEEVKQPSGLCSAQSLHSLESVNI